MKKLIAVIAGIAAVMAAFSALLYKLYLRTGRNMFGYYPSEDDIEWAENSGYRDMYIRSRDGFWLHGALIDNNSDKWAVLVHGYGAEWKSMSLYARKFIEEGYSVFIPDQRGYGLSGDKETTMGHFEKDDIIDWTKMLIKERSASDIIILGVSMGAATAMLTASEDLPEEVRCIVEDCGYTSAREEFEYNMWHTLHLPAYPFLWITDIITRIMKGWSFLKDADCVKAVSRAKVPICFIHGSGDTFVPYYMHKKLYDSCPRKDKELLIVDGAEHTRAVVDAPKAYWNKVFSFIEKHTK